MYSSQTLEWTLGAAVHVPVGNVAMFHINFWLYTNALQYALISRQ